MKTIRKGTSSFDVLLVTIAVFIGLLGVAGAVTIRRVNAAPGGAAAVEAEHAHAIMRLIEETRSFEDMLSYADTPLPGATWPRPSYVELNRESWYSALRGGGVGALGSGDGRISITQEGSAPNRLAIILVSIEPSWRGGSPSVSLVSVRTE